MVDCTKSVDLVDKINIYLSKINSENIDELKLELNAWDIEIIREWNQKALKYEHIIEAQKKYLEDLQKPGRIIVENNVERTTALKIIGLIESIRTHSRSQLDEALVQLIRIIKMTFVDYDKERLEDGKNIQNIIGKV